VVSILSLKCPVCGAPFSPGDDRCGFCGSILVLQTDHPRIDPRALNKAVIDDRIREYRKDLRSDPYDVTAHYGLGVAYYNLSLTDAAIQSLKDACRLTPENPNIHTQLAVAYRELAKAGDQDAAGEMSEHIQYALRPDPQNVEAILLRSDEELDRHDYDQALAEVTRAYGIAPDRVRPKLVETLVAWIRWQDQRGEDTEADWQRLDEIDPAVAREERQRAGKAAAEPLPAQPGADSPQSHRTDLTIWDKARGAFKGFMVGLGIGLISVIALAIIGGLLERDSGPYNVVIVLFALSFVIPIVLAIRGWYTSGRKDTSS
jgi:tetratricopeptide (TPR) repeat protein